MNNSNDDRGEKKKAKGFSKSLDVVLVLICGREVALAEGARALLPYAHSAQEYLPVHGCRWDVWSICGQFSRKDAANFLLDAESDCGSGMMNAMLQED